MTTLNQIDPSKHQELSTTILVDTSPEQVFDAITNVRDWWTGEVDGATDELGSEFTYRYKDIHSSKQKITELVRGKRLVWKVLDSRLTFVADQREWNGTSMTFDIARNGDKTEVRFAHVGLTPAHECYKDCSKGWSSLIGDNLRLLIEKQAPAAQGKAGSGTRGVRKPAKR